MSVRHLAWKLDAVTHDLSKTNQHTQAVEILDLAFSDLYKNVQTIES